MKWRISFSGFTLVELIVVITILAILATIGFLALSGYTEDARDSAIKANVRSIQTAISGESAITNNSPRYYAIHDTNAALSGAFVYVDGESVALTWGDVGALPSDSNYTAGNPNYAKLKLNPEKFKISRLDRFFENAFAAYDSGNFSMGAVDVLTKTANGTKRATSWFQVAGVSPVTKKAVVTWNFPTDFPGSVSGLIRDPSLGGTWSLADGAVAGTIPSQNNQAAAPADQHSASVTQLLHLDGTALNTVWGWTLSSSNVTWPSDAKFGTNSASFNGTNSYIQAGTVSFWTGNFTVEGWAKTSGTTATDILFANGNGWAGGAGVANSIWLGSADTGDFSRLQFARYGVGTYSAAGAIPTNAWFHWALAREGNTVRAFINGSLVLTATDTYNYSSPAWAVGAVIGNQNRTSQAWSGQIDEVRITTGTARYTANFTIPASAFPNP